MTVMASCSPRNIFVFTKPVIQILAWIIIAAVLFYSALFFWPHFLKILPIVNTLNLVQAQIVMYVTSNIAFLLFPLGGFLGDVSFGRYKAVMIGLIVLLVSQIPCTIGTFLAYAEKAIPVAMGLLILSFILLVVALTLFNSNILQYGLDQLVERPSESLGVFSHWVMWSIKFGMSFSYLLFNLSFCGDNQVSHFFHTLLFTLPACLLVLFTVSLLVGCCTKPIFNRERVRYNPYKMIFKVLNFARKNKYPVGPVSAFAHCYDFRPSRLDYAKERYGGPFTTSDVEDVKAFKNVFLVLLALGPIFVLGLGTESLFNTLQEHTGNYSIAVQNKSCVNYTDTGLYELSVLLAVPVYMWLIYCVFQNRRPKILHRLGAAALAYILAVTSMLAIDLTGHVMLSQHNQTQAMCLFVQKQPHQTLQFHWGVVLLPRVAKSFSRIVLLATGFEFISAQSPHTMKGVLVGSFFAIIGVFSVIGAILAVPFSLDGIWKDGYLGQHPQVVSCGFGYYLVCITVATIGFISFIVAVKRYKYRRRDEEPYSQACVEEIFARRIASYAQHTNRMGYQKLSGLTE